MFHCNSTTDMVVVVIADAATERTRGVRVSLALKWLGLGPAHVCWR
jgi:hypothetical protein